MPYRILTTDEAATYAGLRVDTIRDACRSGRLPAKKFGVSWVIHEADLLRWMALDHKPGRPSNETKAGLARRFPSRIPTVSPKETTDATD